MVVANLGDHRAWHTCSSERDDTVEGRTAGNGLLRLVVLEQDIQHRFTYTYYMSFHGIVT